MCAVVFGFVLNVSAQDNAATLDANKPEFKFNEEKHDFGKVPQGTPVTTVFTFKNVGNDPLILTEVKPTCGCTIADYTKTPVKKGASGKITITYNAAVAAPFSKTIVVTSNAKTPQKYLTIIGEVVAKAATSGTR